MTPERERVAINDALAYIAAARRSIDVHRRNLYTRKAEAVLIGLRAEIDTELDLLADEREEQDRDISDAQYEDPR